MPTPPETHLAVHHQQLAVRAIVHLAQVAPIRLVKTLDLDSGRRHLLQQGGIHLDASDPVEQHVDFDPSAGAFGQSLHKLLPDIA